METVSDSLPAGYTEMKQPRDAYWCMAGVTCLAAVDGFNATITGLSGPFIQGEFHATPDQFAWTSIAYLVAKLVCFIIGIRLAHDFGPRRMLLLSSLLFLATSFTVAISDSLDIFIAARLFQGIAGGLLITVGQSFIAAYLPRDRQPTYQMILAIGTVILPSALAPFINGWLAEEADWRVISWIAYGMSIIGAGILLRYLPQESEPPQRREAYDWLGAALLVAAVVPVTYVLLEGNRYNWWDDRHVCILLAVGLAAAALFVLRQCLLPVGRAWVDFRILRHPHYFFAFVVAVLAGVILFGSGGMLSAVVTKVLGYGARDTGMVLMAGTSNCILGFAAAIFLIQFKGADPMKMPVIGLSFMVFAFWWISGATSNMPEQYVITAALVRGFGMGILFLSLTLDWVWGVPRADLPTAAGLFNFNRQVGGMLGMSTLGTYVTHQGHAAQSIFAPHLTASTATFADYQSRLFAELTSSGISADQAQTLIPSLMGGILKREAVVLSLTDSFLLIVVIILCAAPCIGGLVGFQKLTGWDH